MVRLDTYSNLDQWILTKVIHAFIEVNTAKLKMNLSQRSFTVAYRYKEMNKCFLDIVVKVIIMFDQYTDI